MKKPQPFIFIVCILCSAIVYAQEDQDVPVSGAQVIADDLIVQGSLAVGFDAFNGESFGFDTFRLKENNLRIHFDDTSTSGSFPSNDWRIGINATTNGGSSYFSIEDATAGTIPFRVLAGAGNDALYVNGNGDVGLGTAAPVVELQVTDGDTPTLRLEQNGASGWAPQSWDVAGNETNFFIRDVTNGSTLPFKIKPGAPNNALFIAANGDIALGNASPTHKLDVDGSADVRDNLYVGTQIGIGTNAPNTSASIDLTAVDKGLLLNRLTTIERTTLASTAAAGMLVYDTDENQIYFFNGLDWANQLADLTSVMSSIAALQTTVLSLQTEVSDLQNENTARQNEITALTVRVDTLENCACGGTLSLTEFEESPDENAIMLDQNIPNPFDTTTVINYHIPTHYNSARIMVVSAIGQVVYDIPITKFGKGSITFSKNNLQSAIYIYSLYVDGKKIDSKRLVVK